MFKPVQLHSWFISNEQLRIVASEITPASHLTVQQITGNGHKSSGWVQLVLSVNLKPLLFLCSCLCSCFHNYAMIPAACLEDARSWNKEVHPRAVKGRGHRV